MENPLLETLLIRTPLRPSTIEAIERIIKRGNVAEVKRELGNIVVIEITRRLKDKAELDRLTQLAENIDLYP